MSITLQVVNAEQRTDLFRLAQAIRAVAWDQSQDGPCRVDANQTLVAIPAVHDADMPLRGKDSSSDHHEATPGRLVQGLHADGHLRHLGDVGMLDAQGSFQPLAIEIDERDARGDSFTTIADWLIGLENLARPLTNQERKALHFLADTVRNIELPRSSGIFWQDDGDGKIALIHLALGIELALAEPYQMTTSAMPSEIIPAILEHLGPNMTTVFVTLPFSDEPVLTPLTVALTVMGSQPSLSWTDIAEWLDAQAD